MPFVRGGDTSATYPPVMSTAGLPGADHRTINEVMGFLWRLATQSGAHLTDYMADQGTVDMIGGRNTDQLIKFCTKVGLLTVVRVDGQKKWKIIDDPDFIHIRLAAEVEWERQQRKDTSDRALAVPVRARDGDLCRYCGVMVMWRGKTSARKGTLDHLEPGQPATVDTMVVACKSCNSEIRDQAGIERVTLNPAPVDPFYSEFTADWLTKNGRPTAATPRPGSQSDTETASADRGAEPAPKKMPAATQHPAGHRAEAASDPGQPGHRAETHDADTGPPDIPNAFEVTTEMRFAGSGRDGTGPVGSSPGVPAIRSNAARTRSRRSARGRR